MRAQRPWLAVPLAGLALGACTCIPVAAGEPVPTLTIAQAPTPESNAAPTLFDLPDPAARAFAARYYRDEGEFKGQYVIAEILGTRRQSFDETRFLYHVRYRFRCILATCCCGNAGIDQRYFEFAWVDGRWRVMRMGGHMSGRL